MTSNETSFPIINDNTLFLRFDIHVKILQDKSHSNCVINLYVIGNYSFLKVKNSVLFLSSLYQIFHDKNLFLEKYVFIWKSDHEILIKIRRPEFYDFVDDVVDDVYEFMIYEVDADSWIPLSF